MTICGKNSDIGRDDLLELARRYNIKGASAMIDKSADVVANYGRYAQLAGVSGYWLQK